MKTESELASLETRIARLRAVLFTLPESEQDAISAEITQLKSECAESWELRAQIRLGEMLAGCGY